MTAKLEYLQVNCLTAPPCTEGFQDPWLWPYVLAIMKPQVPVSPCHNCFVGSGIIAEAGSGDGGCLIQE